MKDYYLEYWIEAVECACDEAGVSLTKEQATQIAGSMQVSHENQGMAFGRDCIPNPLSTELDNERRKKKDELKAAEAREDALKKNIASRYNVPVWVSVRDGRVEVEAQR